MIKGDKRKGSITVFNCHKWNGAFPICWSFLGYATPCWTLLLSTHMPSFASVTIHALPGRNRSFYGTKLQDNADLDSNHLSFSSLNFLFNISTARTPWSERPANFIVLATWAHVHGHRRSSVGKKHSSSHFLIFYATGTLLLTREKIPILAVFSKFSFAQTVVLYVQLHLGSQDELLPHERKGAL